MEIGIGNRVIGTQQPVYFIADIAANHDGSLERARMLIHLAKEAGANAAKFQSFLDYLVSPEAQALLAEQGIIPTK